MDDDAQDQLPRGDTRVGDAVARVVGEEDAGDVGVGGAVAHAEDAGAYVVEGAVADVVVRSHTAAVEDRTRRAKGLAAYSRYVEGDAKEEVVAAEVARCRSSLVQGVAVVGT